VWPRGRGDDDRDVMARASEGRLAVRARIGVSAKGLGRGSHGARWVSLNCNGPDEGLKHILAMPYSLDQRQGLLAWVSL
jgi:hypothetical protein